MTALAYALGVLLFVVGLAVSIGLHEMAHMIPAKRFGVKVTQFFIGFGKTVWSRTSGDTEYGLKAVPLGGFVKIVGSVPPGSPRPADKGRPGFFAQLISDARAAEYASVRPGDEDRLFYRLPWWKKVITYAGGATTNLVLAFIIFGSVFMLHGVATPTTTVRQVSDCVIAATAANVDKPLRKCTPKDPVAPARQAGMRKGDVIVAFNGETITSWSRLEKAIRSNRHGAATIVVRRDGHLLTLHTNTTVSPRPDSVEDPTKIVKVGFLGVSPTQVLVKHGAGYTVRTMGSYTWQTVKALAAFPGRVVGVAKAAVGLEQRSVDSPMSVVGASRVAGGIASDQQVPLSDRFFTLLMLIGVVNLFLGVFNFVPLPPMDGGHIAGALYEAVRRGIARLRHRPDPGYVDVAKLLPVAYVMAGVILVLSLVLIYADVVAPIPAG